MPLAIGVIVALSALGRRARTGSGTGLTLAQAAAPTWAFEVGLYAIALTLIVVLWWADVIRPGSFGRKRRDGAAGLRDVSFMPWWGWLAAATAMFCAMVLGASLGGAIAGSLGYAAAPPAGAGSTVVERSPAEQTLTLTGAFVAGAVTGIVLIVVLARAPDGPGPAAAGLRFRVTDAFHGLGWFLLAWPIVMVTNMTAGPLMLRFTDAPPDRLAHETLRTIVEQRGDPWVWGLVLGAAVGAPVVEEITYRVFIQSGFLRAFRSAWPAIVVTSLCFAAMHLSIADPHVVPGLFVLSVCMGVAYERTRRLGVPIAMHVLFNVVNLARVVVA
ncbi:MAG: lysostaphin resistance A-like protein [Phycisphaerales bacterium]